MEESRSDASDAEHQEATTTAPSGTQKLNQEESNKSEVKADLHNEIRPSFEPISAPVRRKHPRRIVRSKSIDSPDEIKDEQDRRAELIKINIHDSTDDGKISSATRSVQKPLQDGSSKQPVDCKTQSKDLQSTVASSSHSLGILYSWLKRAWDASSPYRNVVMNKVGEWKQRHVDSERARHTRRRRLDQLNYYFRMFLARLFSTAGLCLLTIGYSVLGAIIFRALERDEAIDRYGKVSKYKETFGLYLWNITKHYNVLHEGNWTIDAIKILGKFEEIIVSAAHDGYKATNNDPWSFPAALLYSITVTTTIGYGNVTPKTWLGKVVTIIYAVIGVPIMLLCLANLGNIMANTFRFSYKKICCICFCCSDKSICAKKKDKPTELSSRHGSHQISVGDLNDHIRVSVPNCEYESKTTTPRCPSAPNLTCTPADAEDGIKSFVVIKETTHSDHNNRVPLWLVTVLVVGYIAGGAFLFKIFEGWPLLDSAYFCFVTLSTIGFGDIFPGRSFENYDDDEGKKRLILCCVYLIIGLSLIAMSFSLVQEEIIIKGKDLAKRIGILPEKKQHIEVVLTDT